MIEQTPIKGIELTDKLNHNFTSFFRSAVKIARSVKGYGVPFVKHVYWQSKAARKRAKEENKGLHVPPFLIYSVTQKCNLNCKGCYAKHLHEKSVDSELSLEKGRSMIEEAQQLGISVIMIAGGEPLTKAGLIDLTKQFPTIVFPLFTNGLLINPQTAQEMRKGRNVFPIISIEGNGHQTDARRGAGVHAALMKTFEILRENHVLFGASITLTRSNFNDVVNESFINDLKKQGVRIVFYIEYIPCSDNSGDLVPTMEQRLELRKSLESFRRNQSILFISFPGDEEDYGGCLAAGRGFVHVGSNGSVEPCPFSPYSDSSLSAMSLKGALGSPLLKAIRENHDRLSEHTGGCALWENREWVENLMKEHQAE